MPVPTDEKKPRKPTGAAAADAAQPTLDEDDAMVRALMARHAAQAPVQEDIADTSHFIGPASPKFFYRHKAGVGAWEIATIGLPGPRLLPVLGKHILSPGTGGIRTRSRNEPEAMAYDQAVYNATRDGNVYLLQDATHIDPLYLPRHIVALAKLKGGSPGGYLQRNMTKGRGRNQPIVPTYIEAWALAQPAGPNQRTRFGWDHHRYNLWRLELITSGRIAMVLPGEVQGKMRQLQQQLQRARATSGPEEAVKALREHAEKALAALEAAAVEQAVA